MEHPGHPRVCAVGESVELAPRNPDPDTEYRWSVITAPSDSDVDVDDDEAVQWFSPDAPGRYVLQLTGGGTSHTLTVRAFDAETSPSSGTGVSGHSGASGSGLSGSGSAVGRSGGQSGSARAGIGGAGEGLERPRVHLDTELDDEYLRVHASVDPDDDDTRVEFMLDDRDDLTEGDIHVDGRTLTVARDRLPARARIYAVAVNDEAYGVTDAIDVRREEVTDGGVDVAEASTAAAGSIVVDRPYDPPAWALDSRIYEIYVRAFGDPEEDENRLAGIRKRLDELDELGIDTLWLTPVLQHDGAPHGYNIVDFFEIAADLGGREEYQKLVDAAHDRGMNVLFDLVCNHSARDHPFFQDAYGNPDSEYYSWYEWQENGEPGTYFEWEFIANFDFSELEVRRHLLDAVDEWAPMVDGFRCDMAWAVPNGFWTEVHDRVKTMDSEFFLLDETIPYIPDFQAGLFDMHFDSTTAFTLREVGDGNKPATAILDAIDERRRVGFPDHASFMLYQENHDETRYLSSYGEEAAFASAGALVTLPGAPMVYAGQETGQLGRRDQLDYENVREDIHAHYERLLALRDEHPALTHRAALERVEFSVVEGDEDAVVAYRREAEDGEAVVTVLNFADGTASVTVDTAVGDVDLVTDETVVDGGTVSVSDVVVVPVAE
ncbi:alpha-amylase MalA [Halobaculum limi]|uniref:alpha-amylase MalA n=1 Tax=Halobaculum limi TaxID=3031916 RepID=UPI002406FAF5|nr:alpha-amylase MalA [Halobaculum sp. YSMS11]